MNEDISAGRLRQPENFTRVLDKRMIPEEGFRDAAGQVLRKNGIVSRAGLMRYLAWARLAIWFDEGAKAHVGW
jgi:hypothetical protein